MAAIIVNDVLESAPELKTGVTQVAWGVIVGFANRLIGTGMGWQENDDELRFARILLAAHYGAIFKRGRSGALGPLVSKTVGAIREAFGLLSMSAEFAAFESTVYGQQLLGLIAMSLAAGPHLA